MKKIHTLFYLALVLILGFSGLAGCSDDVPSDGLMAPELLPDGANDIARTSCSVSGKFSGNLNKISEYGVKYSTSNNFPTDATTILRFEGSPGTSVTAALSGLSANTHYYYCWFATTGNTEVRSAYGEFSTTSTSKPQFSEVSVDSIAENYALLRCRVEDVGDQYLVEGGFSYRLKSNANSNFTQVAAESIDSNNEFTVAISDLTAATSYEVRPYAKNSADAEGESGMLEGYGETVILTTENKLSPELETYDATDVSMNSARLLAKVTSAEGSDGIITERGFCYSTTSQTPTIYDQYVQVYGTTVGEVFETTLTGLDQLTTYYVRPYAKNLVNWQERVGYGSAIEFTTSRTTAPQVSFTSTDDVTVTTTTLTVQAQIDNYYPNALTERGFIWSTDDRNISLETAKAAGNCLQVTSTDKVFSGTLKDLTPSTNYYIRAYAVYTVSNESLTGLSDAVSFATNDLSAGTFKDLTLTSKTTSSLTLTTGISDLGDGTLSEMGFIWRSGTGTVTLDNCDGSIAAETGDMNSYSAVITGLTQATGYTVRGYVKTLYNWQEIISYSDALYCETNEFTAATLKDITCTAQSTTTLTVSGGIDDLGNGELEEKGFIWREGNNVTPTLDKYDGLIKVEGSEKSAYTATLTGLSWSTEYCVRGYVKTTLDGKTQIAYSNVVSAATTDLSSATFKSLTCTAQTTTTLAVTTGISDLGDGDLSEKGFLWRVSDGVIPTLDNSDGSITSGDADYSSYSAVISDLQSATTYSVRGYVKTLMSWKTQISYSDVVNFTTNDFTLATLKELTCTAQTTTSLTLSGGISDMGNGELVEKGYVWTTEATTTPTVDKNDGSQVVTSTENSSYTTTLTGLNWETTYRIRGYVKTQLEGKTMVAYTNLITATTSALTAPTLKDLSCTAQTTSSLTIQAGISEEGDGTITEKGICWRAKDGVTPTLGNCDGTMTSESETTNSYSFALSNLQSGTTYTMRAYVKVTINGEEYTYYSNSAEFTTNDFIYATLKDISCTAKTPTTLTVETGISDMGNGDFVEKGFIWSKGNNGTPTLESCDGSTVSSATENSSYSVVISGLSASTTYRLRGYVKTVYEEKTLVAYTSVISGTTENITAPTMNSITCSASGDTGAKVEGGIDDLGNGTLQEKGFCWKIGDTPTLDDCDGKIAVTDGTNSSFTSEITDLHLGTTYYFRAYAKTKIDDEELVGYSYSRTLSTTSIGISTSVTSSDTQVTVTFSCDDDYKDLITEWSIAITKEGNTSITTSEDSYVKASKNSEGVYQATLKDLKSNTSYTANVRAKHKDGYYIETSISFSTLKGPSKEDMDNPTIKQ